MGCHEGNEQIPRCLRPPQKEAGGGGVCLHQRSHTLGSVGDVGQPVRSLLRHPRNPRRPRPHVLQVCRHDLGGGEHISRVERLQGKYRGDHTGYQEGVGSTVKGADVHDFGHVQQPLVVQELALLLRAGNIRPLLTPARHPVHHHKHPPRQLVINHAGSGRRCRRRILWERVGGAPAVLQVCVQCGDDRWVGGERPPELPRPHPEHLSEAIVE
mmetsp:Transcript_36530/g.115217  ORF Transcript_36530/g.115217 Transcript_36530/m.115217 type:complete len:213 (-) Transcript_36530:99-737(-)